ncbi:MAG: YafY family transcriptional regulator [Massilia sp.]|jgi:biotin operon repressor|nr:YafY family transcriptional regulator [Massilia sp.]
MSRTQRLLDLLQILRRHRYPVTGAALAAQLGISLRTLYRDIAALQQQGANIAGEAGMGYVLRPGYMLPPLMFSEEEIDALALGLRWVARQGDARLAAAARDTLAKIGAVLPPELREALDGSALLAVAGTPLATGDLELPLIRQAIRAERSWRSTTSTCRARNPRAPCGRWRSAFSTGSGCWSPGASCARGSAISAPTGSHHSRSRSSAIRAGARRCSRNGAACKACPN